VALTIAEGLLARGHRVDLLLAQDGGELRGLAPKGARLVVLGAGRLLKTVNPLASYLRKERPDALHALMWPLTVLAVVAHRLARSAARLVLADHGTLSREYASARNRLVLKATLRWIYPLADHRIAVSDGAAEDMASLSGLRRSAFDIVRNPLRLPVHVASTSKVEALWSGAEERILTIGSLTPVKNHTLLIRAFARLLHSRPGARLMIVGEGNGRPQLATLIEELGLGGKVMLPGFVLDPWPFLASADLFALSSDHEAYGLVLVEALHAGLKVVSTDCPSGPREILDAGRFGALVPVGDERAISLALEHALAEPADRARQRARAAVLAGTGSLDRYEELLLGQPSGRRA
jgi:glycosyltransferase involved in cell wall biosynthesis